MTNVSSQYLSFVIVFSTNIALGQQLDTISAYAISIADIGYNTPVDSVEEKLGKPIKYSIYEEEGSDKLFYSTYDAFQLTFYEWNKATQLSSFDTNSNKYMVKLGHVQISVDDSIKILKEHFPNSYHEFTSRLHPDKHQVEEFYIRISIPYSNAISYDGIVNIKILENKIVEIVASFRPA